MPFDTKTAFQLSNWYHFYAKPQNYADLQTLCCFQKKTVLNAYFGMGHLLLPKLHSVGFCKKRRDFVNQHGLLEFFFNWNWSCLEWVLLLSCMMSFYLFYHCNISTLCLVRLSILSWATLQGFKNCGATAEGPNHMHAIKNFNLFTRELQCNF